jgi:uncharacterized membrane protein
MTTLLLSTHSAGAGPPSAVRPARPRLDSIDIVRGIVMVLMALDHVKMSFGGASFSATDLTRTTPAYFLTRWVSHFCAPTFVFLAGTGAFPAGSRGQTRAQLSWFLLTRGLWLVFLELTVVRFSWTLNLDYTFAIGQVLWAIGWSMVVLSVLVFLPLPVVTAFGVAMIAGHNYFDGLRAEDYGPLDWLWRILHTGDRIEWAPGRFLFPAYPLIPWIGVMAAGYGFGPLMRLPRLQRRKALLMLGSALTLAFVVLRAVNVYGDKAAARAGGPGPWSVQDDWLFTVFSFLSCQKYPPSLCFLFMTLGPAIIALALFDREPGPAGRVLVVFGRVPLFFYLIHFYLIKGLAIVFALVRFGRADWFFGRGPRPEGAGYDLWVVYLVWLAVVLMLFPPCRWFAGVKRRSRAAWLSYL